MSTSDIPARPRTSVEDFKELQAADDVLERKRRAKHVVKSRHRPTEHAAMDMNMTSDQFGTRPGTSIHGDATQQYHRECFQHDGTSIPARHRMLPHVMVDPSHQKAMTTLSVLRKHQFITRSPAHTRAMTISQRGYVEVHKHGLTQFHSLEDLSEDLTSFTLMTRLAIIKNFREYKVFRNWELCVRHRKFKERCLRLERIMLMQNRSAWACAMDVNKECHALMSEVKEQEIHPPSQGLSVEMLVKELQRRKEILIVSLDMARKRIMYIMDTYFAAVSGEMNVERLRQVRIPPDNHCVSLILKYLSPSLACAHLPWIVSFCVPLCSGGELCLLTSYVYVCVRVCVRVRRFSRRIGTMTRMQPRSMPPRIWWPSADSLSFASTF